MYLSYFGIRVTNLPRSVEFYTRHFGLRPMAGTRLPTEEPRKPAAVLLVDPVSSQRIELNFYPAGSPYAVPYVPGEGWDHLSFRVDDVPRFLAAVARDGIVPERMAHFDGPMATTPAYRVAYLRDPDGNQIEVYDTPGPPPESYSADAW